MKHVALSFVLLMFSISIFAEIGHSPPASITGMPANRLSVTIGDGSVNARFPMDMYWRNSLYETIYYPEEIGIFGCINELAFYNNFVSNLTNKPTKIWLGITTLNNLSSGWIPATQLTLVYDGSLSYPSGENMITIPLQTPFVYTGGNMVMLVSRPMDTSSFSASDFFNCETIGTNRSLNTQSNSALFDPAAPPATFLMSGTFPKITIFMSDLGTDPIFMINPPIHHYGAVLLNTNNDQVFSVVNAGGAPLIVSEISYMGSEFMTLIEPPDLSVQLMPGQSLPFTIRYNPTAAGTHSGTIIITDNMAQRQLHNVELSGSCVDATIAFLPYLQNFDDVTAPALPFSWPYLVQSTYTTARIITTTDLPHSPNNCVLMNTGGDAAPNMILVSPPVIASTALNTMRTKFWARASGSFTLIVGVMTNPQDASTFVQVGTVGLSTEWTQYLVSLSGYTGAGHSVAFKHGVGGIYRSIFLDDILLEVTPQHDLAAIAVSGNSTPSVGSSSIYTVSVRNWGLGAQNAYSVKLFNQHGAQLGSAGGINVNPGQIVAVPVAWTPNQEGPETIYGKTVLTTDENSLNDQSPDFNVVVQPQGMEAVTIGIGDQEGRIPLDFWWKNSLFETMFYSTELGNVVGTFYGLNFYNNFSTELSDMPAKIWLGTTTQNDLSAGWIPSTQLQLVFDGTVDYPAGENTISIGFSNPFIYSGTGNLVMMVQRPMDTEYHSSGSVFKCQTEGVNRSLNAYSDSETYNPAAPSTEAILSGQFPKTTLFMVPGGVGHIAGTVLGADNQPLAGVAVQFLDEDYSAVTDGRGYYSIQNMVVDSYTVIFSHCGYDSQSLAANIQEDQTLILNVNLAPMATVNLSGRIVDSDTGIGLNGAAISFTGYQNYTANSNATGAFTIPAVYANNEYSYSVSCPDYTTATGTLVLGSCDHNMGDIGLVEIAYAPINVLATAGSTNQQVNITWMAPNPDATEITESFEDSSFPPLNWTQNITNVGTANASGVYPTWCRFGSVTVGTVPANPPVGDWQAGLWWSYEHQDEWLITPNFNCPQSAYLNFASYVFLGSAAGDHYYVKVSTDDGLSWTVLWDASAQTGGWNYYATPVSIDLSSYGGQQLKLAWQAIDPVASDGMWYVWFIDNIYIGNAREAVSFDWGEMQGISRSASAFRTGTSATTLPSRYLENGGLQSEPALPLPDHNARDPRTLIGYKVWRLAQGQEARPHTWTDLTPNVITTLDYQDLGWANITDGAYRWAVRALYGHEVPSAASFSNVIVILTETGMISGVVRTQNNQPIPGALITAGEYSTTTNNSGAYSIIADIGSYSVQVSANNYKGQTVEDIVVRANQTTTVNFVLIPALAMDDPLLPVAQTALLGNYPNPFNPSTTITYALGDPGQVSLVIYNLKGQKVKTLLNQNQASGRYQVIWNGRDDNDRPISSGLYYYVMKTGTYKALRKMLLIE